MKHSDIKPCTVCGGEGSVVKELTNYKNGNDIPTKENFDFECHHCKGTKLEPVRTKLDVPDGYDERFYFISRHGVIVGVEFFKDENSLDSFTKYFPHPIGQELELVCEECGGEGRFCVEQGYSFDEPCEYENCPSCNGNPVKKVKLKDVAVDGNELVEYWEEKTNE